MAGEGPHVLADAPSVVHDVQREAPPVPQPFQVVVEPGRLPAAAGEDGAVRMRPKATSLAVRALRWGSSETQRR